MSETSRAPEFPIEGAIFGPERRLVANLLVWSGKGKARNVVFIVDTGARRVLLSFDTLQALFPSFIADELDSKFRLYVHSYQPTECIQSSSYGVTEGLNILGYEYLLQFKLSIVFDHEHAQFQLVNVPFVQLNHEKDNTK